MKIRLIYIGKTNQKFVEQGVELFAKRINRFAKFSEYLIPHVKKASKLTVAELKKAEAEKVLNVLNEKDYLVLLDEKGKNYNSLQFANWFEKKMTNGVSNINFLIGGAYGFDEKLYDRANTTIRLSDMTFSHQIIRVIFAEQLYRAFSIINHLPYHNE